MNSEFGLMLRDLEERLNRLRPYTRREFQGAFDRSVPGIDEKTYRKCVFDYDRSPYIEKRGLDRARAIVVSVSPESYPDPDLFLLACLQRLEAFLFELFRPAKGVPEDDEARSLMFKAGVRKVMRVVAERLKGEAGEVWGFRRKLLDALEEKLWRFELGLDRILGSGELESVVEMGETLHSLSPMEMKEFHSRRDEAEWFVRKCGAPAHSLVELVSGSAAG